VKGLVPAYLDPNLQPQDLITGVCFASGGAGYDPLTPKIVVRTHECSSLSLSLSFYVYGILEIYHYLVTY
jgi:hypothetical protein